MFNPEAVSALEIKNLLIRWIPYFFLTLVFATLSMGSMYFAILQAHLNRPVSFTDAYQKAFPKWVRLIIAGFCVMIVIGLGFIFCIIPGLIFFFLFSLVLPVLLFEDHSVLESFRRSWRMVRENLGKVVPLIIVFDIIILFGGHQVSNFLINSFLKEHSPQMLNWVNPMIQLGVSFLVVPLSLIVKFLLYYDIRITQEGFNPAGLNGDPSA